MKFSTENVVSAAEIDNTRQSVARICTIGKIVIWSATVLLLALAYPFCEWFAGQLSPLPPDSNALSAIIWGFQSALLILGAGASFVAGGLSLIHWPFAKAIELNRVLQPLEDFEASHLLKITEAHPDLDNYRRSVAAVREFVKGDYEFLQLQEQAALKQAQNAQREKDRQAVFAKLHRVE